MNAENKIEEKELVNKLSRGDEMAFEILFYRYRGKVSNFVRRSIPPYFDVEETVNEIFLRVWIHKQNLNPAYTLEPYLFRIARNYIIDLLRKNIGTTTGLKEGSALTDIGKNTTENTLEEKELQNWLRATLDKMPEKRRKIFELHRFEGLSYRKIAEQLNISENTVDTQMRRAIKFMQQEYRKLQS